MARARSFVEEHCALHYDESVPKFPGRRFMLSEKQLAYYGALSNSHEAELRAALAKRYVENELAWPDLDTVVL